MTAGSDEFQGLFGNLLRSLRESRRLSQVQVTNAIGVNMTVVSKWEKGRGLPPLGQLHELRKALELDDEEFELLRFAWVREKPGVPIGYLPREQQPQGIIESLALSTDTVRRLRGAGDPRAAMRLSERDASQAFDRIRELRWSKLHAEMLARLSELLVEQCKAGLDFISRPEVKKGALGSGLSRLRMIDQACRTELTRFYADLATEGVTYVGGDVDAAFGQSMRMIEDPKSIPLFWRGEVLRAAAINAGKVGDKAALTRIEALLTELIESSSGIADRREVAFLLEGLARAWAHLDPERGIQTIDAAWKAKEGVAGTESGSRLRHVQLVRSEAEIALADRGGADPRSISRKIGDALAISEHNGYDRYTNQLRSLLKGFS